MMNNYPKFAGVVIKTTAGVIMILAGLCPKVSAVASVIPTPVFGGAVLMMFGVILVSGVKIIGECNPDARMSSILAVSLAIGLGFNAVPESLAQFPLAVSMLLCGVPGTALSGVILNLLLPGRPKLSDAESYPEDVLDDSADNGVSVSQTEEA